MSKIKATIFICLLGLTIVNPTLAIAQTNTNTSGGVSYENKYQGVDGSIRKYLCAPSETPIGKDVENCINKLYRFGVSFGAIALVFFIVLAGYMYITGGESGKAKAKGILQNALVGIGILLGSYVLLSFINPNLLMFRTIQPPIFTAPDFPDCEAVGFGKDCILPTSSAGADINTDFNASGSYTACGKTFTDPNTEKGNIENVSVKIWTLGSNNQKITKSVSIPVNKCISTRVKKAFAEYYNLPDKFPIRTIGGHGVRKIAGTTTWSGHAYGLTIDISALDNCHANNDGSCKKTEGPLANWCHHCSPYSITENSGLYKALKANGFGWGGHWKTSKDWMHFSCIGSEQGNCD